MGQTWIAPCLGEILICKPDPGQLSRPAWIRRAQEGSLWLPATVVEEAEPPDYMFSATFLAEGFAMGERTRIFRVADYQVTWAFVRKGR